MSYCLNKGSHYGNEKVDVVRFAIAWRTAIALIEECIQLREKVFGPFPHVRLCSSGEPEKFVLGPSNYQGEATHRISGFPS